MKRNSLVLCFALMLVVIFAFGSFAATTTDITSDARFEQDGSKSDLLDLDKVIDGDYTTGSSCGNDGENWVNYRFYYDEGTTVSKVFVVLNSKGTLSNGKVYETVSDKSYEFYVRLYDKFENTVFNTKYKSNDNATEVKDAEGNVLYTYFEIEFDEPYSDVYMVEVPVVNNKDADVGLWEVEIYNYVCGDDEHKWVGTLCGEHCDVCGTVKDPTLVCEAEEDDGDCRTAVLCKYCDSVIVASQKHVFAEGETVCSNPGCVFEGKNIAKDTTITPTDVSENSYGENGEFLNWWYYSAHITDGKYDTIAHSNYWGQYKFTFNIKNPTTLSEIFIVSNSSGVYHPWGYGHDNLTTDLAVKVVLFDADGNVIQTVEYNSLDFTNPNVVPIYAETGEMTSVAYKLDTNYATVKKVELYINQGVWEVEIYEHVTCDYQFVETVAPLCETEGYDLYKCACGNEKYENAVDALGHNYDDGVVTKEAGEEEDGEIVYTCATCGGTKSLAIPATGHEHNFDSYVGISIEPTCAVVGSATYQCRCGDTTEVEVPATEKHNYNVFLNYTVEPTYIADGYANYKCATCDGFVNVNVGRLQMNTAKYAEVVKELGGWTADGVRYLIDGNYNVGCAGSHNTNGWAFSLNYGEDYTFTKLAFVVNSVGTHPVPPFSYTDKTTKNYSFAITLYDADGKSVWSKSTTCADAVEMTGVDANGNQFLYDIVTIELDEAVVASKLYVKINSGWDNGAGMWEVETYGLPVNYHEDHIYSIELERYSDPTCSEDGMALYRCAKCETTSVESIPALGHKYTYACDKVCVVCNEERDATHTMVHVDAKASDCTNNGNVEYWYCSDCGYAWLDEACTQVTNQMSVVVPATGHSYFYPCDVVCQVCYQESNPDAKHTIVHVDAKDADCTNNGNVEYWYCSDCGYAWLDEACTKVTNKKSVVVPATGHDYQLSESTGTADIYVCSGCGDSYSENTHTHTEVAIPAVLPTPSKQGFTAGIACAECEEVIKAPVAINVTSTASYSNFGIGSTSLAITENISVNYKVNNKLGYSNVYMVFVFENGEYIVTENYYEASSGRYVYNFDETRPHLMNSLITAYVYGEASEGEYVVDVYEYSVAKYCINQLKKSTSATLKTAISDLVVYGAYTQRYMSLSTELITTVVTNQGCVLTPSTFTGIAQSAKTVYVDVDANDDLTWKSSTVAMGSSTEVLFKFAATDISNLQIKIEVGGVEKEIIDASELTFASNRYEVHVSCITSLEYGETVTATFIKNGVESDSVSDSINNYLGRNVGKYADGNATGDLMKAIYLFGESVTKYFETL